MPIFLEISEDEFAVNEEDRAPNKQFCAKGQPANGGGAATVTFLPTAYVTAMGTLELPSYSSRTRNPERKKQLADCSISDSA